MLLTFADVLSGEVARELAAALEVRDGEAVSNASATVAEAVQAHPLLALGVQPRSLSRPSFHRLEPGAAIDNAMDVAIVHDAVVMRADVSITVFLSDASDYDGGDLLVDTGYGYESYKPPAGGCVVRPTSARYGVAAISRGVRWTGDLWAQTLVRGEVEREIVYDIGYSLHLLELFGGEQRENVDRLRQCRESLLRLWAEP